MGRINFLKKINERFTSKVFIIFTIFVIIITSTFTIFFIRQQNKLLKVNLKKEGEILTEDLVYHSRLGVFTENTELLEDPVNVIMKFEEVVEVSVYNGEGDLLKIFPRLCLMGSYCILTL